MGYCDKNGVCHTDDCQCEACLKEMSAEAQKLLALGDPLAWREKVDAAIARNREALDLLADE